MKDFFVIFTLNPAEISLDKKTTTLYRYAMRARSFGEAERKFNKQTSNKFGQIKYRIITEIRLK